MATKKAGGSSKNGRDSRGKRLGVKIFGGALALKGSILLRQRGSTTKPGLNVRRGKDFTLYALERGDVFFSYNPKTKKKFVHVRQGKRDLLYKRSLSL